MPPPLIADANLARSVVRWLREQGCDVLFPLEEGLGRLRDEAIVELAIEEGRVVVTQDKDFGQLAIQAGMRPPGIIFLRPGDVPPAVIIDLLRPVLAADIDWSAPLIVVSQDGKLRLRAL